MAEQKTKLNNASVETFLNSVADENRRNDSFTLLKLMQKTTGMEPKMWGTGIVGFGNYHYKYDSGHEGDAALVSFAPRKQNLVLYLMGGFQGQEALLKKLGKHKTGKGCLYINTTKDIDTASLAQLITISIDAIKQRIKMTEQ